MTAGGFTLVELAVVMLIIGLLTGGAMKGMTYIQNARITATITQIGSYQAAIRTFQNTYKWLPGDLPSGTIILPDCTDSAACNGDGNGAIAYTTADNGWALGVPSTSPMTAAGEFEKPRAWIHLKQAGFIDGITADGHNAPEATPGATYPETSIGGYLVIATNLGAVGGDVPGPGVAPPAGTVMVLRGSDPDQDIAINAANSGQAFTPYQIFQIDQKIDDGNAYTGTAAGFGRVGPLGTLGFCSSNDAATLGVYNTKDSTPRCGLVLTIDH